MTDIEFKIPEYVIEIGVITGNTERKVNVGLNNAELMFIQENGSPVNHIPARPVLQMTLDYANKHLLNNAIDKAINSYLSNNFNIQFLEDELNKLCLRMESYARHIIYDNDGKLVANAPSTIAKKGYNHPLFMTGQLARSITCRLRRL